MRKDITMACDYKCAVLNSLVRELEAVGDVARFANSAQQNGGRSGEAQEMQPTRQANC